MKTKLLLILIFAEAHNAVLCNRINIYAPDSVRYSKCLAKAESMAKISAFDSAIYYYTEAGVEYLQSRDTSGLLKCDYQIIKQLVARRDEAGALNFLKITGKKFADWFKVHPLQEADYHYKLGEQYTNNLKFDSAVISYNRSLPLWISYGKDSVRQIKDVYKAISYAYSSIGEYDSTIHYLQKSIGIYSSKYGFQNRVAVNTYLSLGNAYFSKGEINKGIDFFRKALKTNLSIPDLFESDLAWTYNSLGISYYIKKDYNLALVYIRKALELFLKIYGEKSMQVAWCDNNIGICYQEMHDDDQAYLYQEKALKIRLSVVGENHPDVASSYNNLGVICEDKKEYMNELAFFKKTLAIRKHLFNEMNQDIALTLSNIGGTFKLMHKYDSAYWYYDKALFAFLNHDKESVGYISEIYVHLSQLNLAQGNYSEAFENITKSLSTLAPAFTSKNLSDNPAIDDETDFPDMIMALENKANVLKFFYEKKSKDPADLEKCLSVYSMISDINDRFSHQLREEGARLMAEGDAREIFGEAVKLSYRLSVLKRDKVYEEMAFNFAEKARAGVLSETIEESNLLHFAGIPDSLLAMEKEVRVDKAECEIKLKVLKQQNGLADSSQIKELENNYFSLTSRYQQLIDTIEIKYPVYKYLQNVPQPVAAKDIIATLDDKTALFEYLIAGDSLFIFSFNNKNFKITAVAVDSSVIEKFSEYAADIRKLKTGTFVSLSNMLYKILILPVIDMAEGCERIIIIPDGQLFYVPFETLITNDRNQYPGFSGQDYLIKHFDVSYHYSANLWLHGKSLTPGEIAPLNGFIGFAPVFKSNFQEGNIIAADLPVNDTLNGPIAMRSATSGGRKFNELIYTEKEITSIVALFAKNNLQAKGYMFAEATEENFKKQAGKYKYVHIASHGFSDDKEPNLSGIAFFQTKQDFLKRKDLPEEITENDEGILFSGETYNLVLNADLVVLSSCESGAGRLMKGEGMMGLSRGFLFAGTPNIVYSLWKIGDLNTAQLMTDFYKYVLKNNSYAHSLRLAKLNLLKTESTAFPKFWSGFELVGQ